MLDAKKRLAVLIIGGLALIAPFVVNQLLILLDSPLNRTDISLYQTSSRIIYDYESGKLNDQTSTFDLIIQVPDPQTGFTSVRAEYGGKQVSFECDYETGKVIQGGVVSEYYTMFFVPVENPMLTFGQPVEQSEFEIIDIIGFFGSENEIYTLQIGERKVYWDVNPGVDGAQFSLEITLYDSNGINIAEGLIDSTCGFLEVIQGGDSNAELTLSSPGNYAMSRNRDNMLLWGLIIGIPLPFVCFIILKQRDVDKEEAMEFSLLVGVAVSVVLIDIIIDVWFYAWFGKDWMLYIHLIATALYGLVCLYLRYGIKWIFPAFLEVAFIFAMTNFVGDPYVPHLTAFMGLYASYLAMLFRSGLDKKGYDSKLDIII